MNNYEVSAIMMARISTEDGVVQTDQLTSLIHQRFTQAILALDESVARDVYAFSCWLDFDRSSYTHFAITLSYNTMTRWQEQIEHASSSDEAKWNYAFWLQEPMAVITSTAWEPNEEEVARLVTSYLKKERLYIDEEKAEAIFEEEDEGSPAYERLTARLEERDARILAAVSEAVRRLHTEGILANVCGQALPVIIHDLEYSPEIEEVNRQANPPELLADVGF